LKNLQHLNEALPKAPRLISQEAGYDWREFDRWILQIQRLLGAYKDGQKSVNLFTGHEDNQTLLAVAPSFSTTTGSSVVSNDDYLTLYWAGV
jgi:hypothetical protein